MAAFQPKILSGFPKASEGDIVLITRGPHKGRIGTLDDFEDRSAVVYFGTITRSVGYYLFGPKSVRVATMHDLLMRNEQIASATFMQSHRPDEEHVSLLYEKLLILDTLYERHLSYLTPTLQKKNLFFAFCSADRTIAKCACIDLCELGHDAWFYEADSVGGAPFVSQMDAGIADADAMLVLASKASLRSEAVRLEWSAGITKRLTHPQFIIVPVIIDDCELPPILGAYSCANLRDDYWTGIGQVARLLAPPTQ